MKTSNNKSKSVKIAIAIICALILAACLIAKTSGQASAMTSVNDSEVVVTPVDATEATNETTTEATTEATEAEETEDEDDTVEVPVYVYIPVETQPETQPTEGNDETEETEETQPATEPEELPEATKPEEEIPEETKPEETKPEETQPAHQHNFSIVWTKVNPTCTAHGYTIYICDGCTQTENRDFVEPIGHEYIVYKQEGYETHWCANCGDTYQVEVEVVEEAEETVPVTTEPATEETEPVEETEPAPAGHTCDPSDGHNHKEIPSGPFTYVYCEHETVARESADGRTKYYPYSWCL